jgi:hypothetical protein
MAKTPSQKGKATKATNSTKAATPAPGAKAQTALAPASAASAPAPPHSLRPGPRGSSSLVFHATLHHVPEKHIALDVRRGSLELDTGRSSKRFHVRVAYPEGVACEDPAACEAVVTAGVLRVRIPTVGGEPEVQQQQPRGPKGPRCVCEAARVGSSRVDVELVALHALLWGFLVWFFFYTLSMLVCRWYPVANSGPGAGVWGSLRARG